MPPAHGPRIINIGVEHPGPESQLWRRGWRDKILPALVKFSPDMILVSAGFDAHRKDEINFGYLSVLERDFEWLSDQIVQVANRCCGGRVVSVLEGGYRIQGGVVSAFARSVAAHVRAMCDTHGSSWDPAEAAWEHEREKQRNEVRSGGRKASSGNVWKVEKKRRNEVIAETIEGQGEAGCFSHDVPPGSTTLHRLLA